MTTTLTSLSPTPALTDEGTLASAIDCLTSNIEIEMSGGYTVREANYVYRSQAKAGTTRFFAYATVYAICRNQRVTLAIHTVPCTETLVATLTYLLAIIHPLRLGIKLLCLERGFYSVPIIRWLKALNFPFLMPAVIRGKTGGTRALLTGRKSYATDYTLNSTKQPCFVPFEYHIAVPLYCC